MELTKADFSDWKEGPVTRRVFALIQARRDTVKEALARGETLGENTVINTASLVGYIRGMDELLAVEFEDD